MARGNKESALIPFGEELDDAGLSCIIPSTPPAPSWVPEIIVKDGTLRKNILDAVHTKMCENLLLVVQAPENLTPAMISAVGKFLNDNGAKLGVIRDKSPMGNLLNNLPFEVE